VDLAVAGIRVKRVRMESVQHSWAGYRSRRSAEHQLGAHPPAKHEITSTSRAAHEPFELLKVNAP
jgi:hypothetical protein